VAGSPRASRTQPDSHTCSRTRPSPANIADRQAWRWRAQAARQLSRTLPAWPAQTSWKDSHPLPGSPRKAARNGAGTATGQPRPPMRLTSKARSAQAYPGRPQNHPQPSQQRSINKATNIRTAQTSAPHRTPPGAKRTTPPAPTSRAGQQPRHAGTAHTHATGELTNGSGANNNHTNTAPPAPDQPTRRKMLQPRSPVDTTGPPISTTGPPGNNKQSHTMTRRTKPSIGMPLQEATSRPSDTSPATDTRKYLAHLPPCQLHRHPGLALAPPQLPHPHTGTTRIRAQQQLPAPLPALIEQLLARTIRFAHTPLPCEAGQWPARRRPAAGPDQRGKHWDAPPGQQHRPLPKTATIPLTRQHHPPPRHLPATPPKLKKIGPPALPGQRRGIGGHHRTATQQVRSRQPGRRIAGPFRSPGRRHRIATTSAPHPRKPAHVTVDRRHTQQHQPAVGSVHPATGDNSDSMAIRPPEASLNAVLSGFQIAILPTRSTARGPDPWQSTPPSRAKAMALRGPAQRSDDGP